MSQNSQKNTCARFSLQNVKRKTAATIHLQMGSKSTLLLFSENRWNSWIYINSQIHIGQSHLDYSRIPPKQINMKAGWKCRNAEGSSVWKILSEVFELVVKKLGKLIIDFSVSTLCYKFKEYIV